MNTSAFWSKRVNESAVLNPVDRIAEVLFGLIMVLTFTGAISASNENRQEVRELLWAALGCNLAWGLVDAIMYLMNIVLERGHSLKLIHTLRGTQNSGQAGRILKEEIQPLIGALLTDKELEQLCERIKLLPAPSKKNLLTYSDLMAAGQIFLLVFMCTLPVALPFAIFKDVGVALRVSNGVALILLFIGGYVLSKYAHFKPILTALTYSLIGILLVAITMALGG